jgi:dihydropteroate synthase
VSPLVPRIVGIINVTPDSFSDGGVCLDPRDALRHADDLLTAGADIVEVGGDSTRPGSTCVGAEAEWARIEPVVRALALRCALAIDTHHALVAERALDLGAQVVNDVSAGSDPRMFEVVAQKNGTLVLMFSRCSAPHLFGPTPPGDIVATINTFLERRARAAQRAGVPPERIIHDTGMGGFVSPDAETSWEIIRRFAEITPGGGGILFGSSRKGFLRTPTETNPADRDPASALTGVLVTRALRERATPLYLRVHNVTTQKRLLDVFS